jgi:Kef-type K+ transport system membrane component KefB/nucleotide-binding universal stress UspA family protein
MRYRGFSGGPVSVACAILLSPAAAVAADASRAASGDRGEAVLIAEIALFLLLGRGIGEIMRRLGQPSVIGALIAGLILGPSLFGWIWPEASTLIFPNDAATKSLIAGIADVGVLLLLLLTGMEMDLSLAQKVGLPAMAVTAAGVAVPFACGFTLGELLPASLLQDPGKRLVASLFLGTALSISSIKIVAMVVQDMNFMRRNLGQIIVASAIMEDTVGWVIVSLTLGIAGSGTLSVTSLAKTFLAVIAFLALSYVIGRPLVFRLIRWVNDYFDSEYMVVSAILLVMLVMALITQLIGVNTVLGAFVAGVLVGESPILSEEIEGQLRGFITAFLMPVFFGISGLGADLTILRDPALLLLTVALVLVASLGKFAGAFLGGKLGGLSRHEALALGCAMNARGSTEVIVASIGLSVGALSRNLYTMILSMAVLTTMAMPATLRWALARLPMEQDEADRLRKEAIDAGGFVSRFERLLVVADDSPNGALAARLAGFLAGRRGHPMTVLTLAPGDGRLSATQLAATARESAKISADEAEAREEPHGKGAVDMIARAEPNDAPAAVAAEAKKGFDLLFIGLADMKTPTGDLSGRVNALAAGFDGPIALVIGRPTAVDAENAIHRRMLVPVNGTDVSRRGAELAFAMVPPADTQCVALHVAEVTQQTDSLSGPANAPERAILNDVEELAERHGFALRTVLHREVEPGEAILSEAASGTADLIVIGASRRVGDTLALGKTVSLMLKRWNADLVVLAI